MSCFNHALVCVVVNNIAWLIITLQIIALSHCCPGLVHDVAPYPPTLFPISFSAQFMSWNKGDCMLQGVFEHLCLERVLECMLLSAIIKHFALWGFSGCLMLIQSLIMIFTCTWNEYMWRELEQHMRNQMSTKSEKVYISTIFQKSSVELCKWRRMHLFSIVHCQEQFTCRSSTQLHNHLKYI